MLILGAPRHSTNLHGMLSARDRIVLNTNKPIYVVDHCKVVGGKLEGGDSLTFNAENDSDAWQKANEWSDTSSWVLFQATHLRLRRDGKLIKDRPLGASP